MCSLLFRMEFGYKRRPLRVEWAKVSSAWTHRWISGRQFLGKFMEEAGVEGQNDMG